MTAREPAQRARGDAVRRVSGAALAVGGGAAGVLAAALISRPAWALPAALLLAVAGVAVAVGLLLLRRPPRPGADPQAIGGWSAARLRRFLLVFGTLMLLVTAAGLAWLLLLGDDGASDAGRTWWLAGGVGLLGLAFVVVGLPKLPARVTSSARPADDPSAADAGWVRLGTARGDGGLRGLREAVFGHQLVLAASLLPSVLILALEIGPWAAAIAVAAAAAIIVAAALLARRRSRPPWVARDGSAIRSGSKQVPTSSIDAASLTVAPWLAGATERSLTIELRGPGRFHTMIRLRRRGMLVLTEAQTSLLVELISRSAIELPRDEHDPKGRFSRALHPTHLTKAEALAVAAEPPGDGEPLPIAMPGQT